MRPGIFFQQKLLQNVEALRPEPFIEAQPFMGVGQRLRPQAANMRSSLDFPPDQPCLLKRLDMFRRCCQRHGERFCELADGTVAESQISKHSASRRIAECMKDRVQILCVLINHTVEYNRSRQTINQKV